MTQKYCIKDCIAIALEILIIINTFFILILFEINNLYTKNFLSLIKLTTQHFKYT